MAGQEGDGTESGRLSRSSIGSTGSGGGGGNASAGSGGFGAGTRPSVAVAPPPERRLMLTQEDRELMDLFRSQGTCRRSGVLCRSGA